MRFIDEPPVGDKRGSFETVEELKKNPGKWGNFYVQSDDESKAQAQGKVTTLKSYVKRHQLPVEIKSVTKDGRLEGWAVWEGEPQ